MRPKRYPYSGKIRIIEKQISNLNCGYINASNIKSNNSSVTFRDGKVFVEGQSIIDVKE